MTIIYVNDLETTGLRGYPSDDIIEIGIVKVDTEAKTVEKIYDKMIGYDLDSWSVSKKKAWIFDNSDITHQMVIDAWNKGDTLTKIVDEVHDTLRPDKSLEPTKTTSYNVAYDFDLFLLKPLNNSKGFFDAWHFNDSDQYEIVECLMEAATPVCKIHSPYGYGFKWPRLHEARRHLFDPLEIRKKDIPDEVHRAVDDAYLAGHIMLKMIEMGAYTIE